MTMPEPITDFGMTTGDVYARDLLAELANARAAVLSEVTRKLVIRQMADWHQFIAEERISSIRCGPLCDFGRSCHRAEAGAALSRFGRDLLVMKNRDRAMAGES